ncbi:MAG: radical SAM protein, partial [Treponema sp.]|nr:radical SAM protein [Treponema sp.]
MKNIHGNSCSIVDVINDPFGFTYDEINAVIGEHESKVLYSFLYKNGLREKARTIRIKDVITDENTKKYIFELSDDKFVETVCIRRNTGMTACVSKQVGCPVQCIFCESGKNGLIRNLTASEIVQQVIFLKETINRIVFMGIGEPLYNYDALIKAI